MALFLKGEYNEYSIKDYSTSGSAGSAGSARSDARASDLQSD